MRTLPEFKSPEEEAKFWDTHDSTEYVDWSKAEKAVFPNLKFTTESISIRLPAPLLARMISTPPKPPTAILRSADRTGSAGCLVTRPPRGSTAWLQRLSKHIGRMNARLEDVSRS
jgi:hypothetical protein